MRAFAGPSRLHHSAARHAEALRCRSVELRICINKTCKRQGSEQVLKFAQDLGIDNVKATATGCLGKCGSGPNMVLLPEERMLHHVATPSDMAEVLKAFGSIDQVFLDATKLRLDGNARAGQGDFAGAIDCYSRALELNPAAGQHLLYSNRSAAHLQAGDKEAAVADARKAVEIAPPGFHNAHIRLVDSLYALGCYPEAAEVCRNASNKDSSFRFRPEFTSIKRALQAVGQAV